MIEKFFNKLLGKRPTKVLFEEMGNFSLIKEDNMKTIKIIDLLNKIANGEEVPKEIIFENYRYYKHPEGYFRSVINSNWIALTTDFNIYDILNDEVEILEDEKKIPEKLDEYADVSGNLACEWDFGEKKLKDKINEILDYLESKGE